MRRIGGVMLTVTGFLACPCHLIITLPLLASLLAGTTLGSFITHNTDLVYTLAGIYFVVALALGYWFLFTHSHQQKETNLDNENDHQSHPFSPTTQLPPPLHPVQHGAERVYSRVDPRGQPTGGGHAL